MKIAIVTLALGIGLTALAELPAAAREALCLVCRVKEGAMHPKPVRATRTYEGTEYGFCSEGCAEEFMTDPLADVPPALPRPAPAFALRDLAGDEVPLESPRGRVVLLDFWAACRVKAVPAAFLIDREGRIVAQWTGAAIDAKALEARLGEMLAAKENPAP